MRAVAFVALSAGIVAGLLGCTHGRTSAPPAFAPISVTADSLRMAPPACVIADASAPTRDTLYTIGVEAPTDVVVDCAGKPIPYAAPPVLVPLTFPPSADLRDVLDRGVDRVDVVVTSNADLIAYAAHSNEWLVDSLPWTTTYLSVGADSAPPIPTLAERDALAHDAVSADARGATGPFPWLTDTACAQGIAMQAGEARPAVGYVADDATARQLAERVAAKSPVTLRVAPFAAYFLPTILAGRNASTVVIAVARDPGTLCGTRNNARVLRGAVPLVDTRAHVIVRRGSGAAFIVATDGTLRFIRRGGR